MTCDAAAESGCQFTILAQIGRVAEEGLRVESEAGYRRVVDAAVEQAVLGEIEKKASGHTPEFQAANQLHVMFRRKGATQTFEFSDQFAGKNQVSLEDVSDDSAMQQGLARAAQMFDARHAQPFRKQFVIENLVHSRAKLPVNFHGLADHEVTEWITHAITR